MKQDIKDFAFLLGLGLVGAGTSSAILRRVPWFSQMDHAGSMRRQIAQIVLGTAGALVLPKKGIPGMVKLASVGIAFSGGMGLFQSKGFGMLAGRRGTSSLTRDQILFLQTQGRAPAMGGPQRMRSMGGPQTMRSMSGAGTRPGMMGAGAGMRPGMMGRSPMFRASC